MDKDINARSESAQSSEHNTTWESASGRKNKRGGKNEFRNGRERDNNRGERRGGGRRWDERDERRGGYRGDGERFERRGEYRDNRRWDDRDNRRGGYRENRRWDEKNDYRGGYRDDRRGYRDDRGASRRWDERDERRGGYRGDGERFERRGEYRENRRRDERDDRRGGFRNNRPRRDFDSEERRPRDPHIPESVSARDLDGDSRARLRSLSKDNAERVARHLVYAGSMMDENPELAYEHAHAAYRHASRIDIVREALGLTAYLTGRYSEALRELRTYRRMTDDYTHVAIEADSERGLGRAEKALQFIDEIPLKKLDASSRIELALVKSGARADNGDSAGGLEVIERINVDNLDEELRARIELIRADRYEELERLDEARAVREKWEPIFEHNGHVDFFEEETPREDLDDIVAEATLPSDESDAVTPSSPSSATSSVSAASAGEQSAPSSPSSASPYSAESTDSADSADSASTPESDDEK